VFVALLLFVGLELLLHRPNEQEEALLSEAPRAAQAAQCGPIKAIRPFPGDRDRTHIGGSDEPVMPPLSDYPSRPPVSGPHDPVPVHSGVYSSAPPIDGVIHSIEHAAVIVWYDPSVATSKEISRIKSFFARGDEIDHVIVAPYSYPSEGAPGRLPSGAGMVLAAWHHLRTCASPSLAVAYAFVAHYRMNIYRFWDYRGDAPERWFAPI
jgi:hypothetical protein